jgi:hypothetical protein
VTENESNIEDELIESLDAWASKCCSKMPTEDIFDYLESFLYRRKKEWGLSPIPPVLLHDSKAGDSAMKARPHSTSVGSRTSSARSRPKSTLHQRRVSSAGAANQGPRIQIQMTSQELDVVPAPVSRRKGFC